MDRDHICDQCGKGFKCKRQLKKHTKFVHEKSFDIKCPLCEMGWPSTNAMRKHLFAKHPEDPYTKKLIEEEGLGLFCVDTPEGVVTTYLAGTLINEVEVAPDRTIWAVGDYAGENGGLYRITHERLTSN